MAGTVEKLESGNFRLSYRKNGVRYRKTIKAKNESEAKKILASLINDVENNTFQANSKIKFVEFAQIWLDNHARPNLSPTTVTNYINMLNSNLLSQIGAMRLTDIKKPHINQIILNMKNKKRKDGKLISTRTIKKHIALISTILNYAIELDYLKYNPCNGIKIKEDTTIEKIEMQVYSENELDNLYNALNLEEDKTLVDMILIDLYTGLRRGELMALTPSDIDFENETISISRNRVSVGGTTIIKSTKNHKRRTFELPTQAIKIFERLVKGKKRDELLFPMHPDTFSSQFKKFLKKNNLKNIRVYDLRHTNISHMLANGVDSATCAYRAGDLISTVQNYYEHRIVEKDKVAKKILESTFNK